MLSHHHFQPEWVLAEHRARVGRAGMRAALLAEPNRGQRGPGRFAIARLLGRPDRPAASSLPTTRPAHLPRPVSPLTVAH